MIGTIRKHSKLLWGIIVPLTIISFVVGFLFLSYQKNGNAGSSAPEDLGKIYGQPVTAQDLAKAQGEFYIYYWMQHYGQWPDKTAGITREEQQREIYIRLLLARKANQLGIQVGEDALVAAASDFLRSLGRNGQPVAMEKFVGQYLAPEGLTVTDLRNFLRSELVVQQMIQALGLSGVLVTPQEAGQLYDRENQEVDAQAVFFAASNYLAQVAVTPDAVAQFYTNNLAVYREPDRVQVSYVFFNVTNYLAAAQAELEKTNTFEQYVDSAYRQYGATEFADAKSPDEAKAKIRAVLYRNRALQEARQAANDFATAVFAEEPAKPENLIAYAKQKNQPFGITAPFSSSLGPEEFTAPAAFTKAAFELSADEPFAGPIGAPDGTYIIALANQLPSSIPSLEQIRSRVTQDFQEQAAVELARTAGTNFYYTLAVQLALGKSFARAAVGAGFSPQVLPPFSLSSDELPDLGAGARIGQIKQAAFTTVPGHTSSFVPTSEGGFVLFVQQMLAIDPAKKSSELPQFTEQVRRARQGEAFNLWLQGEINRELRDTPFFQKQLAGAAQ